MNFDEAFKITVGHEGGYTTNRADRGNWTTGIVGKGELKGTKYGISAMAYPKEDIKNLTLDRAKQLYKRDYWDKCRCDELPSLLRFHVFDAAVNSGNGTAVKTLQQAVGVNADGIIGNQTFNAVRSQNPNDTLLKFYSFRIAFYTKISTFNTFGKGWMNRVASNLSLASQAD